MLKISKNQIVSGQQVVVDLEKEGKEQKSQRHSQTYVCFYARGL